jgi:SAM-dependent methyltransferase
MLLTAFTPTHKLDHIRETAISLAAQSVLAHGHEIEWVIGYNNGLTEADVLAAIGEMPAGIHVRFPEIDRTTTLIGQLKRELCLAAQGEVLLELDHDDILAANAFERLLEVLGDKDTAFIYSDSASFDNETLKPFVFDPMYGWEAVVGIGNAPNTRLHGQQIVGMRAQAPSARALCQILYAPDHFRAWTRKAYLLVGGHDAQLPVCDDHDLLCRTYINTSIDFIHIPESLYYYRRGTNTFAGPLNSLIQNLSGQGIHQYPDKSPMPDFAQPIILRDKYLHDLVLAEGRRTDGILLDIGGGVSCPVGWTSVDLHNGQITRDVRRGLPFADNSVFAIRAHDFLEHLEPQDAAWFIGECWRVLKHGGWLLTRTPADSGVGASCDLSHVSRWNTRTWVYFWSGGAKAYRDQAFPGLKASFQPVRIFDETVTLGPWPCQWPVPYVVADLVALKGGPKLPGRDFI